MVTRLIVRIILQSIKVSNHYDDIHLKLIGFVCQLLRNVKKIQGEIQGNFTENVGSDFYLKG